MLYEYNLPVTIFSIPYYSILLNTSITNDFRIQHFSVFFKIVKDG